MSIIATMIIQLGQSGKHISDVHVVEGRPLLARGPRGYQQIGTAPITQQDVDEFLSAPGFFGNGWREKLKERGGTLEAAQSLTSVRLRVSAYAERGSEYKVSCEIRLLPLTPPDTKQLGLPPAMSAVLEKSKGLFLITGPTGAGKTTTLSAMLGHVNDTRSAHVLTIEQPIEYVIESKRGVVSQREVGTNVRSFGSGLRDALRQRPDVIAIGEVLDKETVDTMLHAADSGHFVIATLHTRNAEDTINRLLSFYSGQEMQQKLGLLSSTLLGVTSQVLVPSSDGERVYLASEVMLNTKDVAQHIRRGELQQLRNDIRAGVNDGMHLLNQSLASLVGGAKIEYRDAAYATYDSIELQQMVGKK